SERVLLFALLWMLLHCAKNERLRIIYVLLSGIALHCVDGLETSDQAFFNDVEKRTFPERFRSDLAVRASNTIGDFSVDAVLERPRYIIIRLKGDKQWKAVVSVYGPGDVLLDQYSEEGHTVRQYNHRKTLSS
uniref:Lipase_3 domain-containing protein n=1 Tax=Haemonchus contortus TaxID=6289 RepID=A0A7I4XV59_HAECO